MAEGQKIHLLGPEAREVEGDAMTADTGFRACFATSFERVAVVSDESWMRLAMRALSFLLPGKAKAFPVRGPSKGRALSPRARAARSCSRRGP